MRGLPCDVDPSYIKLFTHSIIALSVKKIILSFGTRPEMIKLAPIIWEFESRGIRDQLFVVHTNQHHNLFRSQLAWLRIEVDCVLDIQNNQLGLPVLHGLICQRLTEVVGEIQKKAPISDWIVHGDTSSAHAAALVAFYHGITVHHVEAGLRTFQPQEPFPEEYHRRSLLI